MIDLGDPVNLQFLVTDATGALADATTVTATITLPDGTTATPTVTHAGVGTYTTSYLPALNGLFHVYWQATGVNAAAFQDSFDVVDESAAIVSLADVKDHLNISTTTYDGKLRRFRDAAESLAESYTDACFRRRQVTGELSSGGLSGIILRHRPVQSITKVTENTYTLTGGYYSLNGPAGILARTSGYPYYPTLWLPGYLNISIDYVAGYGTTAPADVKQAILDMIRILWDESQRPKYSGRDMNDNTEAWTHGSDMMPPYIRMILDQYRQLGIA